MSLTTEQERASHPQANVWVAASAGTGKTHVLTARILRLLLHGVPPEQLLCLTFTKAAAAEMANRLRQTLGEWTHLPDIKLDAAIYRSCGEKADAPMRETARRLFAHVLDLSEGLRIQTIHAFCQALLARFPLEAGLSPQFEVMEDSRARELLALARDQVIAQARQPLAKQLNAALSALANEVNEQDFDSLMNSLMVERRLLRDLIGTYGLDGLLVAVRQALGVEGYDDQDALIRSALEDDALPLANLRHFIRLVKEKGGKTEKGHLPDLETLLKARPCDRIALWDSYCAVFLTQKEDIRKTSRYPVKAVRTEWPDVADFINEEGARILETRKQVKLLQVARFTDAALRIGAAVLKIYDAEKAREAVLDYDDLILSTERLLQQEGIAPWILYKLDAGITHVLVDEAQDTNPEQWSVIEALTSDFYAGDSARTPNRTIFAVGDVKQSIYGFQRADPREFIKARDRVRDKATKAKRPFHTVPLDLSFRSVEAVLALVDAVFADPETAAGLRLDHGAIRHQASRKGDAGLVELWPIEPKPPREKELDAWDVPFQQEPDDDAEARLAVRIATHIRQMLDRKEQLPARARAIRPGDILVLVQRRTAFVEYLVKKLKQLDVAVAGSDRLTITDQIAVQDLLACARMALLPEDDLTLATVLKGPLVDLSENDLFKLAHDRGQKTLWAALVEKSRSNPAFAQARAVIDAIRKNADTIPPFEFFSHLAGLGRAREALIGRMGYEVVDPLDELLRLAQDFEKHHPPSLQRFLQWIERGGAEIKRDPEQKGRDEVRIMTVHGAKGLQAPIVYLPDCCRLPRNDASLLKIAPAGVTARPDLPLLIWRGNSSALEVGPVKAAREDLASKADEEYRRLLYVALTRAEDRLYVAGWESRNAANSTSWYDMIKAGMDRLPGLLSIEDGPDRQLLRYEQDQRRTVALMQSTSPRPDHVDCPSWLHSPPPLEPTPARPLAPSRPDGDEPASSSPLAAGPSGLYQRGLLIHRLLELLPDLPADQRKAAAKRFLSKPAHGLAPEMVDRWWHEVEAILSHPDFYPLFGPDSAAEVPLAGLVGDLAISGQIDRLAITEDAVFLVDYKTNRPPPKNVADVSPVYLRQMGLYKAALQRIYPDKSIHCALLWTDVPHLMTLPESMLETHSLVKPD
ncbi:double-strand break repair helicase AddA [Iodidimonas gelatinilytica]|nr:double-strand break repair helicase AddA [Iodidimonas gelatinilytica]